MEDEHLFFLVVGLLVTIHSLFSWPSEMKAYSRDAWAVGF